MQKNLGGETAQPTPPPPPTLSQGLDPALICSPITFTIKKQLEHLLGGGGGVGGNVQKEQTLSEEKGLGWGSVCIPYSLLPV